MKRIIMGSVCLSIAALASCGDSAPKDDAAPAAGIVSAEGDFATNLQTALIEAVSGSTSFLKATSNLKPAFPST